MGWESVIGHGRQVEVLKKALETGRLAHAYLFTGPEGAGKEQVAFELASALNCRTGEPLQEGACGTCAECRKVRSLMHPNVEYLFPVESVLLEAGGDGAKRENKRFTEAKERFEALLEEKRSNPYFTPAMERSMGILTEQVVALQQKAGFMPAEGSRRIFIISQAERLHPAAANKLLKLLEEPPQHVLFILVSSRPDMLLPTIRSRCQSLPFGKVKPQELRSWLQQHRPEMDEAELASLTAFARGNLRLAWELLQSRQEEGGEPPSIAMRNRALDFLRTALTPGKLHESALACEELARSMSRRELVLFFGALLLFFQDVLHRQLKPGFQELNNPDIADSIDRFARNFPDTDYLALSKIGEEAIRQIERNAAPLLVLSTFTASIRKELGRS